MSRLSLAAVVAALFAASSAALIAPIHPAAAAEDVVLSDFETADSLRGATLPAGDVDHIEVAQNFATTGKASLRFDIGAFDSAAGKVFPRVWLNVGSTLPDVDWTQRQYLHVGMANASAERARMYVVVWDKAGKYLLRSIWADPYDYRVFQIRTADITAAGVDLGNLDKIQLSTERSASPKLFYADDVRLTDTPADVPAEQARVAGDLIGLMRLSVLQTGADRSLEALRKRIPHGQAAPDQALTAQADALEQQLADLQARIDALGGDVPEARAIWTALTGIDWKIKRLGTLVTARAAQPKQPIGLGFADSMSRVYPRDLPCACTFGQATLDTVRGEHESVQLVAIPYAASLGNAEVHATVQGQGVSVDAHPVYSLNLVPPVEQKPAAPTKYRPAVYEGWTPDPIQTARDSVNVASGDLQAFWISVETSRNTKPGDYQIDLELRTDGVKSQRTQLELHVHNATIADRPGLRTAIGHDPAAYAEPYGVTDPAEKAKLVEQEYAFLSEYGLQGDNIYRSIYEPNPPSVESLRKVDEEQGGLRQFNVWYFDPRLFDLQAPDTWQAQSDVLFDRIQPYIDQYRAAGFADKAYLYCCDETRAEYTAVITYVLTRFNERFPDVKVLTTAIDDQMGSQNGLGDLIDWWVRDVPWYDPAIISQRHAAGREAWWYLHAGNTNPTPNLFVNYDPGQLRVLLGPMSHQAGVDGFLYYRVDRWYGHGILDSGPLSSWEPRTWNNLAGDGSLLYPGPDGPIPSIRLENIRDGLEDYNLLDALRTAIDRAPAGTDPRLIERAKRLVSGSDVVTSNFSYVDEPSAYRGWRSEVLRTLDRLT
ncbi:DUF4091 domain-containing protein [Flindersiella endophytica]